MFQHPKMLFLILMTCLLAVTHGYPPTVKVCMESIDPGSCSGAVFERWTFNGRRLTCEPFVYTGCGGNRNNFLTADECDNTCGGLRGVFTDPAVNVPVNQDQIPTDTLNSPSPPVDCVTRWSKWSPCSVTCGVGHITSYRTIEREAANGGRSCPMERRRYNPCNLAPCK